MLFLQSFYYNFVCWGYDSFVWGWFLYQFSIWYFICLGRCAGGVDLIVIYVFKELRDGYFFTSILFSFFMKDFPVFIQLVVWSEDISYNVSSWIWNQYVVVLSNSSVLLIVVIWSLLFLLSIGLENIPWFLFKYIDHDFVCSCNNIFITWKSHFLQWSVLVLLLRSNDYSRRVKL